MSAASPVVRMTTMQRLFSPARYSFAGYVDGVMTIDCSWRMWHPAVWWVLAVAAIRGHCIADCTVYLDGEN